MTILQEAIEDLYRAFSSYRVKNHVSDYPYDLPGETELLTVPLRSLTGEHLASFAINAVTSVGSVRDFKHFLPRILQLLTEDALHVGAELIYGKLAYADWPRWPASERVSIQAFTLAWFAHRLEKPSYRVRAKDLLECAGLIGIDLSILIAQWEANPSPCAISQLADLVTAQATELEKGTIPFYFWRNDAAQALPRWLLSGRATTLLAAAVERNVDHPDAGQWALAHDILLALTPPVQR